MSDLLRPEPPPDWRGRAHELRSRLAPARVAVGVVVVVAVGFGAVWLLRAPAPPVEASLPLARPLVSTVAAAPGAAAVAGAASTSTTAGEVVVQIAGAVVQPGVYRLAAGARVADLIAAAGGVTAAADPGSVLLAAPVADGARVYVPEVGESPPPPPSPPTVPGVSGASGADSADAGGSNSVSAPLDLNAATEAELDDLPGVGPATATAIVAHRQQSGPFSSVDQLLDVRGIGPAKLEAIRALVRV